MYLDTPILEAASIPPSAATATFIEVPTRSPSFATSIIDPSPEDLNTPSKLNKTYMSLPIVTVAFTVCPLKGKFELVSCH
jgi:hypothetical protein